MDNRRRDDVDDDATSSTPTTPGSLPSAAVTSAWTPASLPPRSLPPRSLPPTSWPPSTLPPGTVPPALPPARTAPPRPWLIPLVALATALVLGVAAGLVVVRTRAIEPRNGPAAAVVRAWAHALAAGRASEAIALSATLPDGDRGLLTDEFLADVRRTHPITDVQVAPRDAVSATLTWKVAGRPSTQVVPVTAGEHPQVARGAAQVSFAAVAKSAPVRIAGRQATAPTILLFPGTYPISSTSAHITYGDGELEVTVDQPRVDTGRLVPTATRAGAETFAAVVAAGLGRCLEQKVLAPPGCPFSYTPAADERIEPTSVAWSLPAGLGELPAPDVTDPTRARVEHRVVVVLTAATAAGPLRREVPVVLTPSMNLTLTKPALAWS